MTTITTTQLDKRFVGSTKNKTGLFSTNTIHQTKYPRNHLITGPALLPRFRNNISPSLLFALSEQRQHQLQQYRSSQNEIEQYNPLDEYNSNTIDSRVTFNRKTNAFPPSIVRHQKLRSATSTSQRNSIHYENKDSPTKSAFIQSHASARLRSEIDYLNNKLRRKEELSKSLRLRDSRGVNDALSYSTSCRFPSASTNLTADRIHKRFSSAATHRTATTHVTIPMTNETSNQMTQILSNIAPPITEIDGNQQDTTDHRLTHAYQIPQQSNVGSESVFLTDSLGLSSLKIRSAKNDLKTVACPFYVMYLTSLAMQQAQTNDNSKENEIKSSTKRKVPVNSRTSTLISRYQSSRRQVNSSLSINTDLTIDDNVYTANSTPLTSNKRLSAKISTIENENSYRLRDILRTSSWNHV